MDAFKLKKRRSGLTLVELLVVLVILAILTLIAVQATDSFGEQTRFEVTQRTLQNVQTAILGPNNQFGANGTPILTGFVADMGRLPKPVYSGAVLVTDPLAELWDPTAVAANGASAFSTTPTPITIPSANSGQTGVSLLKLSTTTNYTVAIPSGWRGPYLQLPVASTKLLDGWGNAFHSIYQAPGDATYPPIVPQAGFPVNAVASLGADNTFDIGLSSNAYAQDQYIPPQNTTPATTPLVNFSQLAYGTVTVNVQTIGASNAIVNPTAGTETTPKVRVVLFAPIDGAMATFILDTTAGPMPFNPNAAPATYVPASPYYSLAPNPNPVDFAIATPTTAYSGSFFQVPIGLRAVQAFQYDAATMVITKRSPLTYLTVTSNSTLTPTLILQ